MFTYGAGVPLNPMSMVTWCRGKKIHSNHAKWYSKGAVDSLRVTMYYMDTVAKGVVQGDNRVNSSKCMGGSFGYSANYRNIARLLINHKQLMGKSPRGGSREEVKVKR